MRVAVFEDDDFFSELLVRLLKRAGYEVVLTCASMEEARNALRHTDDGSLPNAVEIDVAIVDGNLTPDQYNGSDGAEVCRLLNLLLPVPYIIGNSAGRLVYGADVQANKDVVLLLEFLAQRA